ncbi:MAG: hypothetical protein ACQERR_06605 [Pseudomonadota bacterium]
MSTVHLYDLIQPRDTKAVERQAIEPLAALDPAFRADDLYTCYHDVIRLFQGNHPGYHASDAWYHDLEHTSTVFLCTSALLQGAHHEGLPISPHGQLLVMAGALFHDVGLIRREGEEFGTGARFTVGHEERGIAFMETYMTAAGFNATDIEDLRHMIQSTALGTRFGDIPFRNLETRTLAQFLATADLVGQMSDRAYLEKLLLLYLEFREAGIPGYHSEFDLLEKTPAFYSKLVRRRLDHELGRQTRLLKTFARVCWDLDHDPFEYTIQRNLEYLHQVLGEGRDNHRAWLRREGIASSLPPEAG